MKKNIMNDKNAQDAKPKISLTAKPVQKVSTKIYKIKNLTSRDDCLFWTWKEAFFGKTHYFDLQCTDKPSKKPRPCRHPFPSLGPFLFPYLVTAPCPGLSCPCPAPFCLRVPERKKRRRHCALSDKQWEFLAISKQKYEKIWHPWAFQVCQKIKKEIHEKAIIFNYQFSILWWQYV